MDARKCKSGNRIARPAARQALGPIPTHRSPSTLQQSHRRWRLRKLEFEVDSVDAAYP
jgi:hypothetical protein